MSKAALIKFRDGVSNEEIAKALNSIKNILDLPRTGLERTYVNDRGRKVAQYHERPFRWSDVVQEYNPEHGEPVFYIP